MHKYQPETIAYAEELQSKVMFGKCAGKITELSKLHKNRIISKTIITQQIVDLSRLIGNAFPKLDIYSILKKNTVPWYQRSVEEEGLDIFKFESDWLKHYEISKTCKQFVSEFTHLTMRLFGSIDTKSVLRWFQPEFPYNRVIIDSSSYLKIANAGRRKKEKGGLLSDIKDLFSKHPPEAFDVILSEIIEHCNDSKLVYSIAPEYYEISLDVFVNGTFQLDMHLNLVNDSAGEYSKQFGDLGKIRKHVIFGNPGDGKTIALHQYCDQLCDDILDGKQVLIPIYIKANQLARSVNSSYEYLQALEEDNPRNLLRPRNEYLYGYDNLLECISDSIGGFNQRIFYDFFHSIDLNLECIFLIDAWDECDDDEIAMLEDFFNEPKITQWSDSSFVITSRNSHTDSLNQTLRQHGLGYTFSQIDHSDEELQEVMPRRLANAWGINSDRMELDFVNVIDNYKEVLTHPLFVGLFCLMLHSNILSESVNKTQSTTSDKSERISIGKYTLTHVEFLDKVIDIGLEVNIKDRKTIPVESMENIRNVFYFIAGLYEFNRMRNLDDILNTIADNFSLELNEIERDIVRNNMGLLFVGKNNLEWTHKTLREVACAKLIITSEKFVNLMKSKRLTGLKYRREGFGECVTLGLVYYKNLENNFGTLNNFTSLLSEWGGGIATTMIKGLELKREPIFKRLIKDKRNGKFSSTLKTKNPMLKAIASEYLNSMAGSFSFPHCRFSLPLWALSGLDSRSLTDIFSNLQHLPLNTLEGDHSIYFAAFPDMRLKDFLQLRINDEGWNRTNDYERWLGYYQDVIIDWFIHNLRFKPNEFNSEFKLSWEKDIMAFAQQKVKRIKHGKTINNMDWGSQEIIGDVAILDRIRRIIQWEFTLNSKLPDNVFDLELPEDIIDCVCQIVYDKTYHESLDFIHHMNNITPEEKAFHGSLTIFGLADGWLIDAKGLPNTNLFKLGAQYAMFALRLFREPIVGLINDVLLHQTNRFDPDNHFLGKKELKLLTLFKEFNFDEKKYEYLIQIIIWDTLVHDEKRKFYNEPNIRKLSWEQFSKALGF